MVQKTNKDDQILVRIDMENGIPRVRQVTGKERKKFFQTHQKSNLPTYSLDHMDQILMTREEMNRIVDPSTISNNPSAK
jgi:hypothetical protein